jgi:hypothetical protein
LVCHAIRGHAIVRSVDPLVFWAALPLVIGIPAVFAWLAWRNAPLGADKGRLQIGPDGVEYLVGADRIHRGWAQVSAIHPVRRPGWTTPTAIWLPVGPSAPPDRLGERDLWLAMFKAVYRPVLRPDGLLLPIGIFGQGAAKAITETLRMHLEAANQQIRNP